MRILEVYIEIQGVRHLVGSIAGFTPEDAVFSYAPAYLKYGAPISAHLPLQDKAFSPETTKCFFEGLLPEGFSRKTVAEWLHADQDDYLSILAGLGGECLGAVQVLETKGSKTTPNTATPDPIDASYRKLSITDVQKLAAEGVTESTKILVESHLSLAGASGKVGLYYDEKTGEWYQPIGLAPSTHIVKQSHVRLRSIVENEQLALRTASLLGIPTVENFILSAGTTDDDCILLATKRYDRDMNHSVHELNGMPCPLRLHQEDFAQALGIQSKDKYEPEGGQYLQKIFHLIRENTINPLEDERRLLDLLIFDVLIGNTDNHIKNLSLLYSPDLRSLSLAPAYDIVSTIYYRESTSEMSIAIGGERQWDRVGLKAFIDASADMGISPRIIKKEYNRLSSAFPAALHKATDDLAVKGYHKVMDISKALEHLSQIRKSYQA